MQYQMAVHLLDGTVNWWQQEHWVLRQGLTLSRIQGKSVNK